MSQLRNAVAAVSVFALGGCQFFGNMHLAHNSHAGQPTEAIASATDPASIQEGRGYLYGNQTGLAIEAFNRALANGEDPALAYNGLGVAYARLGRFDLAYRLFNKAIMSDPTNPIFKHNRASLVNSAAFTLDQMTRLPPVLATGAAHQSAASTAAAPAERAPGKLYRDGNRQFSLVTTAPNQARVALGERSPARDDCTTTGSARAKHQCRTIPLPTVQSRTRQPALTAFNEAFPTSQVPTTKLTNQPLAALTGKHKIIDLRSLPQSTPREHTPQQSGPTAASAKT